MKLSTASAAFLSLVAGLPAAAEGHTVWMCINPGENEITAYAGTYHTNSKVGGMIISGPGFDDNPDSCPSNPYGSVRCGTTRAYTQPVTSNDYQSPPWTCGDRYNWDNSGPALTHAQVIDEAPNANCAPVGNAADRYPVNASFITWNKVTIPVTQCGPGIIYKMVTTADSCDDVPWRNVWATVECVQGNGFQTCSDEQAPVLLNPEVAADRTGANYVEYSISVDPRAGPAVDLGPDVLGQPGAEDDCDPNVYASFDDDVVHVGPGTCPNLDVVRTWSATDNTGKASTTHVQTIEVRDTTAPIFTNAPPAKTVQCSDDYGPTSAGAGAATAYDVATDFNPIPTFVDVTKPGSCASKFTIDRTWTAADECGNTVTHEQTINVIDDTAPYQTHGHRATDNICLWPPNHGMYCISDPKSLVRGEDNCDADLTLSNPTCVSNELSDSTADGSFEPDCTYDPLTDQLCVRAERQGSGTGRDYTISFEATDDCGNTATFARTIHVPKDPASFESEYPGKNVEEDCIMVKKPRAGKDKKGIFSRGRQLRG